MEHWGDASQLGILGKVLNAHLELLEEVHSLQRAEVDQ